MPQPITRVGNWWSGRPRNIRLFTYICIPPGIALFCTGLWLDHIDWWTRHAFLLNVASSVTGVCFGGPIAVLLFNQLSSAQDEARQTERARVRAGTEAAAFQSSLLSLFTTPDLADLTATAEALREQIKTIRSLGRDDPARDEAITSFLSGFDALRPSPSGRPRHDFRALIQGSDELSKVKLWRTQLQNRWQILHTQIRPQLADGWLAEDTETAAHQAMEQLLKAGRNPWMWERGDEHAAVNAMRYFLDDLNALCQAARALEPYI